MASVSPPNPASDSPLKSAADIKGSLAQCLVALCDIYGKAVNGAALLAGLPLRDGELTPSLFDRAAARAGLAAQLDAVSSAELLQRECPLVLLLNDRAVLLLHFDRVHDEALIWDNGQQSMETVNGVMQHYSGYAISVSPADDELLDSSTDKPSAPTRYQWFTDVVKSYWRVYRDVLVASFLINLFALVSPLFIMNVYDRVVPNNATETLWMLALGVLLAFIFDFALKVQRAWFIDHAGKGIDQQLSATLFAQTMGLKMAARPASTGSFVNQLNEFDSLRSFITSACITTLVDLPFVLLFLALIVWIGGALALIPLLCMGLCLALAWGLNRPLQQRILKQQQMSASRQALVTEALQGLEDIKTSAAESSMQLRWERMVLFLARNGLVIRRLQALTSNSAMFVLQLNTVALVIGGVYLIGSGALSMGGLIAIIMIAGRCAAPVSQLIGLLNQYERARQALDQGEHIMAFPQERQHNRRYLQVRNVQGNWHGQGLGFAYSQQSPLLSELEFRIQPQEKLAILGRMGSGKTTLVKIMLGLLQPTAGSLSLDGIDLRQLDPAVLRQHIGYLPQSVSLFSGTIRDNIVMGRAGVGDDEIIRVARLAGLGELISDSAHGLDFQVGEAGRNLSGGQVQAVGLARALVGDPKILVLDEPATALDNQACTRLRDTLRHICEHKTLIMVTHQHSMLALVNRVVVLEQGKIIADGPAEMLSRVYHNDQPGKQPARAEQEGQR